MSSQLRPGSGPKLVGRVLEGRYELLSRIGRGGMADVYRAFFRPLPKDFHHHPHGEAPLAIVLALSGTALCTVLFFLYPNLFLNLALLIKEGLP